MKEVHHPTLEGVHGESMVGGNGNAGCWIPVKSRFVFSCSLWWRPGNEWAEVKGREVTCYGLLACTAQTDTRVFSPENCYLSHSRNRFSAGWHQQCHYVFDPFWRRWGCCPFLTVRQYFHCIIVSCGWSWAKMRIMESFLRSSAFKTYAIWKKKLTMSIYAEKKKCWIKKSNIFDSILRIFLNKADFKIASR